LCDPLSAIEHSDEADDQPEGTSTQIACSTLRIELRAHDGELVKGGHQVVPEGRDTDEPKYGYDNEQQGVNADEAVPTQPATN
jgi:hypothetical protein